jgi:ATP-dependent exoDNAse (exonuclease V) alpha subunit
MKQPHKIEFNAAIHPHFDHGYAVTSYSAQGLTADRVLINADMAVHPDLLSSRFAYVSVSRARLDAEIYTNRIEDLGPRLGADIGKSSAVEFSHSIGEFGEK